MRTAKALVALVIVVLAIGSDILSPLLFFFPNGIGEPLMTWIEGYELYICLGLGSLLLVGVIVVLAKAGVTSPR